MFVAKSYPHVPVVIILISDMSDTTIDDFDSNKAKLVAGTSDDGYVRYLRTDVSGSVSIRQTNPATFIAVSPSTVIGGNKSMISLFNTRKT